MIKALYSLENLNDEMEQKIGKIEQMRLERVKEREQKMEIDENSFSFGNNE